MSETELQNLLQEALHEQLFPGYSLAVWNASEEIFSCFGGQAEIRPNPRLVQEDTVWDIASLTKVLGGSIVAMKMVANGQLDLHAPLQETYDLAPAGITAAHCLSHCSGMLPWRKLFADFPQQYLWGTSALRNQVFAHVAATPNFAEPGEKYKYSDLGMMLLCKQLEIIGGKRFDQLWHELTIDDCPAILRWGWPKAAATEDCPVRRRVLVGEVHDLNTAVLGGAATHAGLFATTNQVAAAAAWVLRAWLGEKTAGLSPKVVNDFWAYRGAGSHRLGWDSPTPGISSAGPLWPADGVGHIGFTGCVLWVAPRQQIVAAFCSNRVHPLIEGGAKPGASGPKTIQFKAFRPKLFSAIVKKCQRLGFWK